MLNSLFGRRKVPHVNALDVAELPAEINLGDYRLVMNDKGEWESVGEDAIRSEALAQQTDSLKTHIENVENAHKLSYAELEEKYRSALEELYQVSCQNDELMYQNQVLVSLCAVTEGDYVNLCNETGYVPRDERIRISNYSSAASLPDAFHQK